MNTVDDNPGWRHLGRTVSSRAETFWSQRLFPAAAPIVNKTDKRFWLCVLTLVVLSACLFLPNRSFPLLEPDEGRRAEISREMLVNDDWIACTLNQQPYYDKPPLFHWLVALSYCCFGTCEASARLVPALVAILTILTTFVLGRRLIGQRAAFLGALALMLMGGFALTGRLVGLDGTLTLFITAALLIAHEAVQSGQLRWRWWLTAAVLCGLGILTKGPIALVLVLPPVLVHARLSAGTARPRLIHLLAFGATAALVATPWVILALVRDPRILSEFLVEHNLRRFADGIAHEEAFWYYLPVLAVACVPWSPLFPFFLRQIMRMEPVQQARRCRPLGLLLLWSCWCVLFFTLSRGKLPLYILPALPAFALLTGWFLEQILSEARQWTALPPLIVLTVGVGWVAACIWSWRNGLIDVGSCVVVGVIAAAALVLLISLKGRWAMWAGLGLAAVVVLGFNIDTAHRLLPALARHRAPLAATAELRRLARSGKTAVACPAQTWSSITFTCRGDIFDLESGTDAQLLAFLEGHRHALVAISQPAFARLKQQAPQGYNFTVVQTSTFGHVVLAEHDPTYASSPKP
ncbi:MAG TPA: glycosyltransferase family 39 protein [Gemmataceae bacterium]|nr:glycosyltransferase family 39 protein [Gemmataceae bacterium]